MCCNLKLSVVFLAKFAELDVQLVAGRQRSAVIAGSTGQSARFRTGRLLLVESGQTFGLMTANILQSLALRRPPRSPQCQLVRNKRRPPAASGPAPLGNFFFGPQETNPTSSHCPHNDVTVFQNWFVPLDDFVRQNLFFFLPPKFFVAAGGRGLGSSASAGRIIVMVATIYFFLFGNQFLLPRPVLLLKFRVFLIIIILPPRN